MYRTLILLSIVQLVFSDQLGVDAHQIELLGEATGNVTFENRTLHDIQEISLNQIEVQGTNLSSQVVLNTTDDQLPFSIDFKLDGPYDKNSHKDKSYQIIQDAEDKYKEMLMDMEQAKNLSQLADFETRAVTEYEILDRITNLFSNTLVPGKSIIDASFIKTPFREAKNDDDKHYGLMIANDGFKMEPGLEELWSMVVQENVKVITSLNEEFSIQRKWLDDVYMYFPDDFERQFNVGETYSITTDKMEQRTCSTSRYLNVHNFTTGELVHQVKHIHFHKWEDFSIPNEECALEAIDILEEQSNFLMNQIELMRHSADVQPQKILTHCMAGRGRTGTAFAIINSMMSIKSQMKDLYQMKMDNQSLSMTSALDAKLSIFSIVRRMREQRATAVQTQEQYDYIYKLIFKWIHSMQEQEAHADYNLFLSSVDDVNQNQQINVAVDL